MEQNTLHRQTGKFISAIAANLPEVSADVMQGWINNPKALQKVLNEALNPSLKDEKSASSSGRPTFILEVDGTLTLEQMIANGKYNWKNDDITSKKYPIADKTKRTAHMELFHFDRDISSEKAVKEMEKAGFRPATIEELLTLGENQPELQRQFPIIALGSVAGFSFGRSVPYLGSGGGDRNLGLNYWAGGWNADVRFLGVRKNS